MNSAMCPCRPLARSSCSRSSASVTSVPPLLSPAICRSTSGHAYSAHRTRHQTTISEQLIRIIDVEHPLFGQRLEVSARGASRHNGWIVVVLPDGRHRWIPQEATDLNDPACDARANRDLPQVSVRTLRPLAEYVRARLSAAREGVDGTSGHAADPAVRAGVAGSRADLGAEIVADDDTDSTTTAGKAGGTATPVGAGRSR